jgi:F5/8 type C domain
MDIISLQKGMKAKKAIKKLNERLGSGVQYVHPNLKTRLEELEKKDPSVELYNRVSELETNTAINLNKHNLRMNAVVDKNKYALTDLSFDDFGDDTGIDKGKSTNFVYDAVGKKVKMSGSLDAEVITTPEDTATEASMIVVSQASNEKLVDTKAVPFNGTLDSVEVVDGKIKLKVIETIGAGYTEDVTPNMTANNAPSPYVVSASGNYSGYYPWKAFNGTTTDNTDGWLMNSQTAWISFNFGSTKTIKQYALKVRNASDGPTMVPKEWTFEGSNTGAFTGEQTVLDTQMNQTTWGQTEKRFFPINNNTAYRYYRLNISQNNGNATYIGIGEIEMMESAIQNLYSPSGSYESPILDIGDNFKSINSVEKVIDVPVGSLTENIIPVMTSNTSPSPIVISASTENKPAYKAFNRLNNSVVESWYADGSTGWLQVDFGTEKKIVSYSIASNSNYNMYSPKKWEILGSNNNQDWTVLDSRENETNWSNFEIRKYVFTNTSAYRYYRINIAENNGGTFLSIGEMEYFEELGSKADLKLSVATSNDGVNFSPYESIKSDGTIQSPSSRYIKVKAELTGGGNVTEKLINDFTAAERSTYEAKDTVVMDGALKFKTSYTEPMTVDATFTTGGTLLRKTLDKSKFKSFEKVEVL